MKLKPYPEYKDSGAPWLGEVPRHWDLERAKWLFRKMDRPVQDTDEVVTCFRDGIVTLRKNRRIRGFTESLKEIGYQGIRKGDLVLHAMDAFAGAIGVADSDGKGTPVYSVCEPAPGTNAYYYAYTVREMARSQWILALAKGIRERSTDFRFDDFASQKVPTPPLPEQVAIVRFLDHSDHRISRLIRTKQKLIALLNEQKQAIIYRAVTRGLDPNVRLKPSGVEWLGDVPEHWGVLKLGHILIDGPRNGISPPVIQGESGAESFSISAVREGILDVQPQDIKYVRNDSKGRFSTYDLKRGDILLVRGNGNISLVGKAGLVCRDMPGRIYPDILMRIRLVKRAVPAYVTRLLNCRTLRDQIENAAKTTVGTFKVNNQHVRQLWLALPPYDEQLAIIKDIEQKISGPSSCVKQAEREISLIREYRTRLIADVVTGKLDVRGVELPELDEVGVLDSPETGEDIEETVDEEFDGEALEGTEA